MAPEYYGGDYGKGDGRVNIDREDLEDDCSEIGPAMCGDGDINQYRKTLPVDIPEDEWYCYCECASAACAVLRSLCAAAPLTLLHAPPTP